VLLPWELAEPRPLREVFEDELGGASSVLIVVGPEGGFGADEVRQARDAGARAISLGRRILRTETAALVVLSALLYAAAGGKLASGILVDRISARAGMLFSIACVGLGILFLLATPADSGLILWIAILFGMGYGGIFNASPTIVFEHFGTHQVGKALGLFYIFFGLGTASGGVLAGYLFDRTHRYAAPFTLDLTLACAALLLVLASGKQTQRAALPDRMKWQTS